MYAEPREDYNSQWYPTTDSMIGEHQQDASCSNRMRLDSGSYSTSSGSATSSTDNSKKKQRRSHRPRGCRGGGARRARKALREQARAREALQENVAVEQHHQQYPPQYVTSKHTATTMDLDAALFKEQQQPHNYLYHGSDPSPAPSLQPCMSTLSNDSSVSYTANDLFNIFPPSTAMQQTHHQYVDQQGHARARVPYGQMTYSDSNPHGRNAAVPSSRPLTISNPSSMPGAGFVNVLPPLPVDDSDKEPDTLEGPNPYSLKSNLRADVNAYEPTSSTLRPDVELYDPPASFETANSYTTNNNIHNNNNCSSFDNESDDERLEKQRNMGAESLFALSPRSFLTGRKGTFWFTYIHYHFCYFLQIYNFDGILIINQIQ